MRIHEYLYLIWAGGEFLRKSHSVLPQDTVCIRLLVLFLRHLYYILIPLKNLRVVVSDVRKQAFATILKPVLGVSEIAAATISQCVKRTIAKQAIEILRFICLMAREKFAIFMLKKSIFLISEIVIHDFPPLPYYT